MPQKIAGFFDVRSIVAVPFCVEQLLVEDCGRGVEPEVVPRLFERFTRSTVARALGPAGAGLGLSIARSYAEAIGGELTYEPASPTGARFALSLPAAVVAV